MKTRSLSLLLVSLLLANTVAAQQVATFDIDAKKLEKHVSHLASEKLAGRRTGTEGATEAAKYIAAEFGKLGLLPATRKGQSWRQSDVLTAYKMPFPYVAGVELGKGNTLTLNRRIGTSETFNVGLDWMPIGFSANQRIDGVNTVFAGYGISSPTLKYDDYAITSAKGYVAVVFSGTPDGDSPHSQFGNAGQLRFKAAAARAAGAKALVVIAKENNLKDDSLSRLTYDNAGDAGLPVLLVSRQAAAKLLGGDLALYEEKADMRKLQVSGNTDAMIVRQPTDNVRVNLSTDVVRKEVPAYNIVGQIEGSDPVLKNETIIIGAHYDHLGNGGAGSLAANSTEVHHGADDNASGTAGMLELARILSTQKPRPKRTIVFMAFSGEEEGLLGSNYYVNNPLRPLANTVAMINMDMIGRMKDKKLIIGGIGTAKEWRQIIEPMIWAPNTAPSLSMTATVTSGTTTATAPSSNGSSAMPTAKKLFEVTYQEDGFGPSDHSSFYAKQIPVLFFWTGTHNDYHKPSDTFDKINYEDEAKILTLISRIVHSIDGSAQRLTYAVAKSDASTGRTTGFRVYLGTIPNYSDASDGLLIDGVRDDSPAAKAGLKAGDKIVKIGTTDSRNVYDYTNALSELKAGEEYVIEVMREGEKLSLKIKPEARK